MKKNWKLILGIIFMLSCVYGFQYGVVTAALCLAIGLALIFWWLQGRKSEPQQDYQRPTSPAPQPQAKAEKRASSITVPNEKDGCALVYQYSVKFTPTNDNEIQTIGKTQDWGLSARVEKGTVHLIHNGTEIGHTPERADMLGDWIKREDPYLIYLERASSETGIFTALIVFYRNEEKRFSGREYTITKLTKYSSREAQEMIDFSHTGERLEFLEGDDDAIKVLSGGQCIGSLPAKEVRRFNEEGAAAVFLARIDTDDNGRSVPYVKIYW